MNSKNLIIVMALAAIGLLAVNGCKLSVGDYQEKTNATEMRYMNENGDFRMPDNGDDARLAMDGITIGSDKVKALSIDWIHDTVTIEAYDGTDVVVSEVSDKELNEFNSMYYSLSPEGELKILFCKPNTVMEKGTVMAKHLFVRVPRTMKLDRLVVDGMSHTLQMNGVSSQDLDLKGLLSSVEMDECELGKMEVGVTCSPTVEARFKQLPDKIELNSSGCIAVLYVPEDAGMTIDVDGYCMTFNSDLPIVRNGKKRVIGDGHCKIVAKRMCAALKIRTGNPEQLGNELWEDDDVHIEEVLIETLNKCVK